MKEAPPIKVWILLIGFICTIYLPVYVYIKLNPRVNQELDFKTELLLKKHISRIPNTAVSAIVLGSSEIECAIDINSNFNNISEAKYCKDIRVYKLCRAASPLEVFTQQSNVFELLLKYPPKYLFLEERMVTESVTPASTNELIMSLLRAAAFMQIKKQIFLSGDSIPFQYFPKKGTYYTKNKESVLYKKILTHFRKIEDNKSLNDYLGRLSAKGTKVVILNIPRPSAIEKQLYVGEKGAAFKKLIQIYKSKYNIDYWVYKKPMTSDDFMDRSHLNHTGMKLFSAWLVDKIASGKTENFYVNN